MKNFKYDTVIFDMDGTVLDTLEDLTDTVNYALGKNNFPLKSMDEVRRVLGNGIKFLMQSVVPDGALNPLYSQVFDDFKYYYREHCNDKTHAYEGILELMALLKSEGIRMAIVSNKVQSAVTELNEKYFTGLTEVAIGETGGVARKPEPDMVFQAMKMLDAKPETTVYVGDSEVDFATAKNSGLDCISVLWGFRTRAYLEEIGAKTFAEKPMDIYNILRSER